MTAYFLDFNCLNSSGKTPRSTRTYDRYAHVCLRALDARNEAAMQPIGGGSPAPAPRTQSRSPSTAKAKKADSGVDGDGDGEPALADLVNKLIERITALSKPSIPVEIDLWNVDAIAAFLKRSESVVRERIVCQPSFPVAIRIPTGEGKRGHALWPARDVIAWAESHRERETA
ncbi:hypothetical protein [Paraburkholderia sediminicola]|uniref:hypothetical protein n=1 Tax=Paraburkholderia sediminicola TaxID=458836 RepID=UPI0038BABA1C